MYNWVMLTESTCNFRYLILSFIASSSAIKTFSAHKLTLVVIAETFFIFNVAAEIKEETL